MGSRRLSAVKRSVALLLALLATIIVGLAGSVSSAEAATLYTATLQGSQEVPPTGSPATGSATVSLSDDQTTIAVDVSFSNLLANASAAHIHGPALMGVNAPVLITFSGFPATTSGTYSQTFAITAAQVLQLQAGLLYVNIHTSFLPGGEIRGQLALAPSAVRISTTSAVRTPHGVLVRWRTASEIDTLGFNVYREVNGKRTRVNRFLIAGRGRGLYSFLDRKAPKGKSVRYWIQAVNLDGSRTWHGPVRIRSST